MFPDSGESSGPSGLIIGLSVELSCWPLGAKVNSPLISSAQGSPARIVYEKSGSCDSWSEIAPLSPASLISFGVSGGLVLMPYSCLAASIRVELSLCSPLSSSYTYSSPKSFLARCEPDPFVSSYWSRSDFESWSDQDLATLAGSSKTGARSAASSSDLSIRN